MVMVLPCTCMHTYCDTVGSGAKKGVMVMSSESEDDVLFKREGPTDTPPPGYTNTIGRQNSNNSSLVSGLIPQ